MSRAFFFLFPREGQRGAAFMYGGRVVYGFVGEGMILMLTVHVELNLLSRFCTWEAFLYSRVTGVANVRSV